jgi:hypothetical protein
VLWEVVVPSALPELLSGIRAALAFAFVLLVASKLLVARSGFGYMIGWLGDGGIYDAMFAVVDCGNAGICGGSRLFDADAAGSGMARIDGLESLALPRPAEGGLRLDLLAAVFGRRVWEDALSGDLTINLGMTSIVPWLGSRSPASAAWRSAF